MTETTNTNNKTPKMVLKLDEDNSVKFKLSIQGTVSDPSQTHTNVRFVVSENKTGIAWMFPLTKGDEENLFKTTIPQKMGSVFSETKEYTGRVEVIVGGRYFNPTTVNIAFERELRVEATPVLSEEQARDEESEDIFGVLKPAEPSHAKVLKEKKASLPTDILFAKEQTKPKPEPKQQPKPVVESSPKKKSLTAIVEEKVPAQHHDPRREKQKTK